MNISKEQILKIIDIVFPDEVKPDEQPTEKVEEKVENEVVEEKQEMPVEEVKEEVKEEPKDEQELKKVEEEPHMTNMEKLIAKLNKVTGGNENA